MADQTTTAMRQKYLHYIKPRADIIDAKIKEFEDALDNRWWLDYGDLNKKVFLPYMYGLQGDPSNSGNEVGRILVAADGATTANVYKINSPGFFYYQHYKGNWDPSGYIQILVCRSNDFSSTPVFELLNTNGNGNDHVNNMFPIRPGPNTYIMARGTFSSKRDTKQLFFAPHWKIAAGGAMTISGTARWPSTINDGIPNSEAFKDCFR